MIGLVTSLCCDAPASKTETGYVCDNYHPGPPKPARTTVEEIWARYEYIGPDGWLHLQRGRVYDVRFGPSCEVPEEMRAAPVVITKPQILPYPSLEAFAVHWKYVDNTENRDLEAAGVSLRTKEEAYGETNPSGF